MSKPHSQMASFGWLYMGLGAIAICLGYMIGASNCRKLLGESLGS